MEGLLELAKLSPPVLYLLGVVVLYWDSRQNEKARREEIVKLLERYHELVEDQVITLKSLAERLER